MSSRNLAKDIFTASLEASLPKNFIHKHCHLEGDTFYVNEDSYDLSKYNNIYIFGSGKAASTMAQEIEELLKDKIYKGLVVAPATQTKLKYIEILEGTHPLPSEKSLSSAQKLLELMRECEEDDLYIYLLSGGSSALIELPVEPISLEDFQLSTELMLYNGLEIQEINTIRKHISQIKGGRLAHSCKAKGIVLVVSDIIDNDLYSIGSAPMYADRSSYAEAKEILDSKKLFDMMPQNVQDVLTQGVSALIEETPKQKKANVEHYIIASNTLALDAAAKSAASHGLSVEIFDEPMQGDVEAMIQKILTTLESSNSECILFGGECTVQVSGNGQGGRNQHAVALMLKEIYSKDLNICFLSAGTDGIDGNSDAAGAVVNAQSCKSIEMSELLESYIENYDSYNLFKKMDTLVMTGPSGTNVIDIAILIKGA